MSQLADRLHRSLAAVVFVGAAACCASVVVVEWPRLRGWPSVALLLLGTVGWYLLLNWARWTWAFGAFELLVYRSPRGKMTYVRTPVRVSPVPPGYELIVRTEHDGSVRVATVPFDDDDETDDQR